jgi:hypothetical protein
MLANIIYNKVSTGQGGFLCLEGVGLAFIEKITNRAPFWRRERFVLA